MKKQIEELGKEIHSNCPYCLFEDEAESIAKFVIEEQGYRKQSDVVREIFAETMKMVSQIITSHIESDNSLTETEVDIVHALVEFKKKYGVQDDTE